MLVTPEPLLPPPCLCSLKLCSVLRRCNRRCDHRSRPAGDADSEDVLDGAYAIGIGGPSNVFSGLYGEFAFGGLGDFLGACWIAQPIASS